jgi:hypothetical protein
MGGVANTGYVCKWCDKLRVVTTNITTCLWHLLCMAIIHAEIVRGPCAQDMRVLCNVSAMPRKKALHVKLQGEANERRAWRERSTKLKRAFVHHCHHLSIPHHATRLHLWQ